MSERILVVDDERSIRELMRRVLSRAGYEVETAATAEQSLARLAANEPDIVITDVRMPGMDGLELLRRARPQYPEVDFLVITGYEDMNVAISAMKAGAYDFLVKPLNLDHILLVVERCINDRAARRRIRHIADEAAESYALHQLVGRHPRMVEIYKLIGSVVEMQAAVLIRGESGTGKEMIARAIHVHSAGAAEPFVAVNCTALPDTLLESELFGHARGAFTGAVADRKGRFELAGRGTIFLDEIGDTSPSFQAKLLRVLQEHEFVPVGGERPRRTQARIIAATHRPLETLIRDGRFREDLYFRLRVIEIVVPPLRERKSDIPLLARHLLAQIARKLHKDVHVIPPDALQTLVEYDWPGNVRELENALTRAAAVARGASITRADLSLGSAYLPHADSGAQPDDLSLDAIERSHVQHILARTGGNKREAARLLGISPSRLYRLIARHGLTVPERDRTRPES